MSKSRKKNNRKISSGTTEGNMFYGLKNQGSTCYLNSVLQVLFMNEEFRGAVKRHTKGNNDKIDRQLSELFNKLSKDTAETIGITNKLGIHSVHKQSDAAEYFEKILKLTSPEASRIFQGQLEHTTKCLKCHKETKENGKFWHLPLALPVAHSSSKDYSVSHAFTDFFKESELSGDNQLYCDHCQGKMDSIVECKMRHHPDVLTLLLKRFEFNYNYMSYTKNNCAVDVPHILHMPQIGPTYELYAVVEHFGSLKSGHYTATIKDDRGARWYNFNDSTVQQINQNNFSLDNRKSYLTESHSPYLLFYRKRKQSASNSTCEKNNHCHDVVKRDGGENATGMDDTAVADSINRDEEPRAKQRVLSDRSSTKVQGNRGSKQSRPSHQATGCTDEKRSGNVPPARDVKEETAMTKNTRDKEHEVRAANVDKQANERTKQKAEPSFQNSVKVQKPLEVNVIRESRSDHVIEHWEMGELITKPNEKREIENVRGVKEVDKKKGKDKAGKVAPRSEELSREQDGGKVDSQPKANSAIKTGECVVLENDDISTTVSASTKINDRKKQSDEPDTDSKFRKKFNCGKWKWWKTGKAKRKKEKKQEKQVKIEKTPNTPRSKRTKCLFFSCKSKVKD